MDLDLLALRRRADRAPADTALWEELLRAFLRSGLPEEGAWRVRNLMLRSRAGAEGKRAFLSLLRRVGFGIGDPGFQLGGQRRRLGSPGDNFLAVAPGDSRLVVYRVRPGLVVLDRAGIGSTALLAWSRDERTLVAAEWTGEGTSSALLLTRIHPVLRDRLLRVAVPLPGAGLRTSTVLADQDTCRIAVVGVTGEVAVLEFAAAPGTADPGGEPVLRTLSGPGRLSGVDPCRLSPDGRWLLRVHTERGESAAMVLDLLTGRWILPPSVPGGFHAASWSEDGSRLAVLLEQTLEEPTSPSFWNEDDAETPGHYLARALVVDLGTGASRSFEGDPHEGSVPLGSAGFRPDGLLHVGAPDWLLDPVRETRVPSERGPVPAPTKLPPGRAARTEIEVSLAWASSRLPSTQHRREAASRRPYGHEYPIRGLQLSREGTRLLALESRNAGTLWDTVTGLPLRRCAPVQNQLRLSRDGTHLVEAGDVCRLTPVDPGMEPIEVPPLPSGSPQKASLQAIDLSPDGRRLVVSGWPRGLEIMEAGSNQALCSNTDLASSQRSLRFVDEGRKVALVEFTSRQDIPQLRILEAGSLESIRSYPVPGIEYDEQEIDLQELPDGSGLVVQAPGGPLVCRYDSRRATHLARVEGASGRFSLSPDGLELALATPQGFCILRRDSLDFPEFPAGSAENFETALRPVDALAWSPDGTLVYYTQHCHLRILERH